MEHDRRQREMMIMTKAKEILRLTSPPPRHGARPAAAGDDDHDQGEGDRGAGAPVAVGE